MSPFIFISMIHVIFFPSERKSLTNTLGRESTFPLKSTAFVVVRNFDSLSVALSTIYLPLSFSLELRLQI